MYICYSLLGVQGNGDNNLDFEMKDHDLPLDDVFLLYCSEISDYCR